jgi:lipopolysaccharide/colanic/teichoic acid biosynthesis glycosyltransferase
MTKRVFDVIVSAIGLVLVAPLLAFIALRIRFGSPGPVFYRGERVGLRGRRFRIYKFRTMVVDAEKIGASSTAADDPRITRCGAWLRRYKLDELPQLINVLLGDMSLVGPRPQVAWAVAQYTAQERKLLEVRPGITDEASIKFRNEGEILRGSADPDKAYLELIAPEKIRLGLHYVDYHSVWKDICILAKTALSIFVEPECVLSSDNSSNESKRAEAWQLASDSHRAA